MQLTKKYNPFIDWVFFFCYCIFFWIFLSAFNNPEYKAVIDINAFGEAVLEFIMFTILFVIGMLKLFWDIRTKTNNRQEKIYLVIFLSIIILMIMFGSPLLRLML